MVLVHLASISVQSICQRRLFTLTTTALLLIVFLNRCDEVLCAHCMYVIAYTVSELPGEAWCVCEWRIRERVESGTAAARPPVPVRHPAGRNGDQEIRPSPVSAPVLSPRCWALLPLSSKFPPPSPGSLHPSALWLFPLGAEGRCVGGVLGHLVMPLPLLDIDTSIVREEVEEEQKEEEEEERGKVEEEDMPRKMRTEVVGCQRRKKKTEE